MEQLVLPGSGLDLGDPFPEADDDDAFADLDGKSARSGRDLDVLVADVEADLPEAVGKEGQDDLPLGAEEGLRRGGARRRAAPERAEEGRHPPSDDQAEDDGSRDVEPGADPEKGERGAGHPEGAESVGPEAEGEEVREKGAVFGVAVSRSVASVVAGSGIVSAAVSLENGRADEDEAESQRREVDGQHGGDNLHRPGRGGGARKPTGPWARLPGPPRFRAVALNSGAVTGDVDRARKELEAGEVSATASLLDPHAILESIPEPVGLVDRQGRVLAFNAAARRVVHAAAPTKVVALGDDFYSFISPHNQPGVRESLERAFAGEAHAHKTEARGYHFETVYSPVRGPDGTVVAVSTRVADVTARENALTALAALNTSLEERVAERSAELERVNGELERAARAKDAFLASMSHELRTPLTGILGAAELLREGAHGPLNDRQLRSLGFLEEAGRHLLSLLSDLLDLARIGAERLSLSLDSCSLGDVCESALDIVRDEARRKGLALAFRPPAYPIRFVGDARRVCQVLVNLLSNAVKFTPEGGTVELSASGDDEAGEVRLEVRDTGPGIAPEDLPKLFQPFTQLDTRLAREHAGTGLGLALVRSLAELHGGRAGVESEPGRGSLFRVVLPWRRPAPRGREAEAVAPEDGSAPGRPTSQARILLVEDDDANRTILGEFFRMRGFSVEEAASGHEALAMASTLPFDLIVLDIQLPGMDGLEVLARLRATGRPIPPVLALTALAMEGDRERILAAGADFYLSKPAPLALLGKEIDRLLAARRDQEREIKS